MQFPGNPISRAVDAAAYGPEVARRITALLPRAETFLDTAELLLSRVGDVVDRLDRCEAHIRAVVQRVATSERIARDVIDDTAELQRSARTIFDVYEPVLHGASGTAAHASERFGPSQVDALVAYLDFLPMLEEIDKQLVPMMGTLGTVAPDLAQLLAVSRGLNEMLGSLPGLGRAKRRVDEEMSNSAVDEA
ncbi:hypothetical protein [uncultured Jatrophihabitans sp.]|uniref:hypothetical protein n=1 Tax=uncultured Jatrophihabitans sp. TaxID=1610747 RepID=UPI0035C9CE85